MLGMSTPKHMNLHAHQILCGATWVNSKAHGKNTMLMGSSGRISTTCRMTPASRFSPQFYQELKNAVANCLRLSSVGDCSANTRGPIRDWNVSAITNMHKMFFYALVFNTDISRWDVSAVTDMSEMFCNAKEFNKDISKWDVSAVIDMSAMLAHAAAFNVDISKWNVSAVIDMNGMFYEADSFNVDISNWDVSAVTDMTNMFVKSLSFDQVLHVGILG